MARKGRLEAHLRDRSSQDSETSDSTSKLAKILEPDNAYSESPAKPLTPSEVADILGKGKDLSAWEYNTILQYLNSLGQPWRSNKDIPHPTGALILPPVAKPLLTYKMDQYTLRCKKSNKGNSAIHFKNPSANLARTTGDIQRIWQIPLEGHMQTFLVVEIHKSLSLRDQWKTPYFSMPFFESILVDATASGILCIIEPQHILTNVTVLKRPKGTYGINRDTLAICWALNRGRRH